MSVTTLHPEYIASIRRWELIRDIINNNASQHIRKPDLNDALRNFQYRKDAILTNFTNLTKLGLTGIVFRKNPSVTLPPDLDYLFDNCTGTGIPLEQFTHHVMGEVIEVGRYGLLIDYNDMGRAYLKPYIAESITNWKTKSVDGECVLSLLVLTENVVHEDPTNIFKQETVLQYRVLRLDDNNLYVQDLYDTDGTLISSNPNICDFNGKPLNRIPFVLLGSENNDTAVDYQPLYDLAILNLGHYRNSADYEESIFICGQPYVHINLGEQSAEEFTAANPNGITFGSRKGILTSGGNVTLIQANPNQLVAKAMDDKLAQAAGIGARLISPSSGRETAEAAKIRYGSQHSALYSLTTNVSDGVEDALELICLFMGIDPLKVSFHLNDEFYDEIADANLVAQMILMSGQGIMTTDEVRDYGIRTGFINEPSVDGQAARQPKLETGAKTTGVTTDGINIADTPESAPISTPDTTNNPSIS